MDRTIGCEVTDPKTASVVKRYIRKELPCLRSSFCSSVLFLRSSGESQRFGSAIINITMTNSIPAPEPAAVQ